MVNRSHPLLLAALCILALVICVSSSAHATAIIYYLDEFGALKGVVHSDASDPVSALTALAAPIVDVETGKMLGSAVLPATKLLEFRVEGDTAVVNFSRDIVADGISEERLSNVFDQVRFTLRQFGLDGDVKILADGKPLSDYTPPLPIVLPRKEASPAGTDPRVPSQLGSLSGRSVTLSPGHGIYWNGSGWPTQRPVYCSPLSQEDFHNLEMMQYLETFLLNDGCTLKLVRCTNKSYGNHYTGNAWWKMGACYWLMEKGYPCSVYGPYGCNLGSGGSDSSNDIASRPLASDYDNTNIYVSLHTNGLSGDCWSGCPSGTETYYDASSEHAEWGAISQTLATRINDGIMASIQQNADSGWGCHGVCVKNSNGAYGEIRIPNRAATLTELAFHDTCNYDADANHLRDNFFRSVAMWGMYKGICQYFGTTPTWDMYSDEYVSDTIPTSMAAGHQYTVSVTFRNKGVVWTEARQIRLGAVGDSDPFSTQTRQYLSGEVGPNGTYTFTFVLTAPNSGGTYVTDWRMVRDGYTWFGATVSKTINVSGTPDTEPPTAPADLVAEPVSASVIDLSWSPSIDNVGVTGYRIFRNGSPLTTTTATSYTDSGLSQNTTYTYRVTAYDAVNNESAQSSPASAITHVVVFQDGFANLNNWAADIVADGTARGLALYTDEHHGTYTGAASAISVVGTTANQGSLSYRALPDTFSCGAFDCWFLDTGGLDNSNQGIHVRGYNGSALVFSAYLGTYPTAPGSNFKYSGGVFDGSAWTWAGQLSTRSIAWHNLKIVIGPSQIKFYVDGTKRGSLSRPGSLETYGISRIDIGREYNVNWEGLYDDAQFTAPPPVAPVIGSPVALSTTDIRWSFTDASNMETGFKLHDAAHVLKGTAGKNASYIDEAGLSPNTLYTRHVHAKNGSLEGPASSSVSGCTLSVAPTTGTVTCNKAAATWYRTADCTFTAVGGFGAGTVQYYRYAWDQSPAHTWTGAETQWSTGDLTATIPSTGTDWYLHVKGYNANNVANGSLDLGPFRYAGPPVTIAQAKALADDTPSARSAVSLVDKVVTANFGGYLYIEEADADNTGVCAIRVSAVGGPARTKKISLAGVISTGGAGERFIAEANIDPNPPTGIVPDALLLNNMAVGGGSLNSNTPGVEGGIAVNNIGMLITAMGRITHSEGGFFYIDDGSLREDGSGYPGIRVLTNGLPGPFTENLYAVVTGICSTTVIGGKIQPVIVPRNEAGVTDVVTYP